ncbi:MAG: sugar phosphate isomerase/epimerase [Prolixibacteraceae bacterium]|jgi:sugar phosphate isomerase/epimerase|nr:sugar phosphate isomerase/epimerase [Prolixibacteraceae bacterium]MBT6007380.1 sugar phosphate isomerase/epimerase [Prolixibacteraceae bacterium]MBT6765160.1 sugar phosphate isomerase/epimerase [Prolixibacteraceae bacterium]MBT7000342.1 sugar phosphate isomerase/epimerase [Prolixibacteraceae bacterium]MBT7395412.1 sugar phosphate isomerase/epimerase [Prolixibacteraceae bacterium]
MATKLTDLSKLCVHTLTTKPWDLRECVENYNAAGIQGITIWRNVLENQNLIDAKKLFDDHNMEVVSIARGGFFPSIEKSIRNKAIDDNLLAIEQAAAVGAPVIVLVCGADGKQSLEKSREQIKEGIIKILPEAKAAGVKLAIEPLHPMYAGDRSAINTMAQANDLAEEINSDFVGVAVDVYHLWWDDNLQQEIMRCGKNDNLFAFHVCDWNVPTTDFLNDRGLMGDGCINVPQIRSWVEKAGFKGYNEVEIFSDKYWAMNQIEYLEKIKNAYLNCT